MRKLITFMVLGLTMSLSITAVADEPSTPRVVRVQTAGVDAYVAQLREGKKLTYAADMKFTMRAWQAMFDG